MRILVGVLRGVQPDIDNTGGHGGNLFNSFLTSCVAILGDQLDYTQN